jgi:hypothetical protein
MSAFGVAADALDPAWQARLEALRPLLERLEPGFVERFPAELRRTGRITEAMVDMLLIERRARLAELLGETT